MRVAALMILGVVVHLPVQAQTPTSELTGLAVDATGGVVPGVVVTASHEGTGIRTVASTNERGLFRLAGLTPGVYRLTAQKPGFRELTIEGLQVQAAQRLECTIRLDVAEFEQQVTVTADTSDIQAVSTHGVRGGAVTGLEISSLPVIAGGRGRNFRSLLFSLGGVAPVSTMAPFTVNGSRPVAALNMLVDSAEFNDILLGYVMGRGTTEQPVSLEAVESFEAQVSSFKAESGRASGAVVNLVTRSGTNEWRGSLYHLFQHSTLNARNALLSERPPARSNIPGFTLGGPLRRNRLFFFGSFELPVRNTYSNSSRIQTLTEEQRRVAVPSVRPLVDLYPLPNIPGTNLYDVTLPNPQTMKSIIGKIDYAISLAHRLGYRQTFTKATGYKFTRIPAASRDSFNNSQLSALTLDSTLGPRLFHQGKIAFSRFRNDQRMENPALGDPALHGLVGVLRVTGLEPISSFRTNETNTTNNYSASSDLSIVSGRHVLKAGGIVRRLQANTTEERDFYGSMVFTSVNGFLAGRPVSYTRSTGDSRLDLRSTEVGLYFQDDWRVTASLTVNAGLRWEGFGVPQDLYGRIGKPFARDGNNFGPRFGFAWGLGPDRRTVLRGGYGVYYNPLTMGMVNELRFAPPLIYSYSLASPSLPPVLGAANTATNRTRIDPTLRQPLVQNWNLTLERAVGQATVSAGWVGSRGSHLTRTRRPNGGENLPLAQRPDPTIGVISLIESSGSSNYHSLQVTARGSFRSGLTFRSAYTWGKSLDDASTFAAYPLAEDNIRLDRGRSDFHLTHLWNGHLIYPLPWLRTHRWLGGWQVAGILTWRSGNVFSVLSNTNNLQGSLNNRILDTPGTLLRGLSRQRPVALAPGVRPVDLQPAGGTLGTLPRNSESGSSVMELNAAVSKNFRITERLTAEFRAEAFNLPNRVNYAVPVNNVANSAFGTALSAQDPRLLQLALRLQF